MKTKHASGTYGERNWKRINWKRVTLNVRLLQQRIVKAKQKGQHRKVKSLQFILTRSLSAKQIAVKRVTSNKGKRTSGVDHQLWSNTKQKWQAVQNLHSRNYKASPLRRIRIPKSNGKVRELGIPTMRDRAFQALYLMALEPVSETTADRNSYGFRPKRSCADAIRQCFIVLGRKSSSQWILEGDIKGCFDHISHNWLMNNIPINKRILHQWLKCGVVDNHQFFATTAGTPQGGIISPTLANMTLDGLERAIDQSAGVTSYTKTGEKRNNRNQVHFVRYADDFIVTSNSKELLEEKIKPAIVEFLKERGLQLSKEKTKIAHINEGFDFLGQNIRKYNGKCLIKPSRKSFKAITNKVLDFIRKNKDMSPEKLIGKLNSIIRGWCNYHRKVISSRIFAKLDSTIFWSIWNWVRRRHPTKSKRWIKLKYFIKKGKRDWIFFGINKGKITTLFSAQSLRAVRHLKIKNTANPFDKSWNHYFAERRRKGTDMLCRVV